MYYEHLGAELEGKTYHYEDEIVMPTNMIQQPDGSRVYNR